uniref:Uncharacterized protein n=1 Tax=Magallana gigas TaxID=29159 RepID=K1QTV6_MAGGI
MDDVLIEMEAIREFVVESLAEFRSELSAMNLKIQSADKKTDELDNSYKDFCEKYSGLEERIENIFQSSRNSSTDSGKRKYISDDEEEEEDEEEDETSIPSTLDDISPQVKENLKKIYNNLSYMKDKEKVTKVQLTFIHYWLLQKDSNCPTKADDIKELISDGIKAGLWKQGWKPDIRGEFQIYLQDKVKNIVKKAKIAKEKARLKKDLESCEDLLESCHSVHFD